MTKLRCIWGLWLSILGWAPQAGAQELAHLPVTNTYHGMAVVDEYQWLEKADDPGIRAWTAEQNRRTRAALESVPGRAAIERRLGQLTRKFQPSFGSLLPGGNRLFALRFQPPAQQPVLVVMDSPAATNSIRTVLDLNELSAHGAVSMDFYVPSPDGQRVAVCLSENGSEVGAIYFYETDTGQRRPDRLAHAQYPTGGGSVAWNKDGTGVFYTRYPAPGERPAADLGFYQQVYFHRLGTPQESDVREIGPEFPRIAEISLQASPDGEYLLANVANGDGGERALYLREPAGRWRQIAGLADQVIGAQFGRDPGYVELPRDDALYLLSFKQAPRGKILRLPLDRPELTAAREFVKEGPLVIQGLAPAASGLYVLLMEGGPSHLVFYDFAEKKELKVPLRAGAPGQPDPPATPTAVTQMLVTRGDELLYNSVSYLQPPAWQTFDPSQTRSRAAATPLREESPVNFDDVEVIRLSAKSRDNTRVPLSVIRRKGTRLNGENPVILYGYGGYRISLAPTYDPTRRLWLDQGGLLAIANLRGGGEFGESWHQAGSLTNKQHVFDDFIACAELLVRSNYTRPGRLAIRGGSNGGLLVGAVLTQRPDLFGAVVAQVGIYDMLRVELDPNGVFNTTEFGTVTDPAQFRALFAYSPYHHVTNGAGYPAVLLSAGEHDGRVNPAHSRKMAARLQAAGGGPTFLRTSAASGHGIGTALSERLSEWADIYAFLFRHLGMDYSLIERGPWSGAITTNSAWVKVRLAEPDLAARLCYSESPDLVRPRYTAWERSATNQYNLVSFRVGGLAPNTQYYYAVEVDGRLDRAHRGAFRTYPAGPASFTIAWASCAKTGSTLEIFDRIREHRPLIFFNVGDFHYLDISENSVAKFRAGYDRVLASPQQADLYRAVPFGYLWDDHDFGGNNCNKTTKSRPAARAAYQEYVPHYPLALGAGDAPIAQAFEIGRVKFLVTDMRSERDPTGQKDDAKKSMLGQPQKDWLKRELQAASGRYPLIVWIGSVSWLGYKGTNYYPQPDKGIYGVLNHERLLEAARREWAKGKQPKPPGDEEHWCAYATERQELADFIKTNHIQGLCYLHGDAHMLAADDGRNGDFATDGGAPVPTMCAAPLDQANSIKGGPYSQDVYRVRDNEGCFGLFQVNDLGDRLEVSYSGRNHKDEEKIALKFTVPAARPQPVTPP